MVSLNSLFCADKIQQHSLKYLRYVLAGDCQNKYKTDPL